MQWRVKISTVFQRNLNQYLYRHPNLYHLLLEERRMIEKLSSKISKQMALTTKFNPFNLCPRSIIFWFLIHPYYAIGINTIGLHKVIINWRQQMEANETIYILFRILELKTPFPITLLLMFSAFGLVITDAAYRLILATHGEFGNGQSFNPFNLTPRMSIYFPVIDNYTSLGFLTIDFRHVEISLKQSLEPNETVFSLIRFLDLYSPFPLQAAVMLLSIGLFINGEFYRFGQTAQEERK